MDCKQNFFQKIINFFKFLVFKIKGRNHKNSELYKHAKYELDLLLDSLKMSDDSNDYKMQKELNNNLLKMVEAFCKYGHSGGSAQYQLENFNLLMHYKPLIPLTGGPNEWILVDNHVEAQKICKMYQNKRYSALFKRVDFDEETGEILKVSYNDVNLTENESKDITFPYLPK